MSRYRFGDLTLVIEPDELEERTGLPHVCASLAWEREALSPTHSPLRLRLHAHGAAVPDEATVRFESEEFRVFDRDLCSFVSDGRSVLYVAGHGSEAHAYLDESFHGKPLLLRRRFWSYGLSKLMRSAGFFTLHAAAVVAPDGRGLVIAGPSGSGKSTLAVGLIRAGWSYLSDDAIALCLREGGVRALPLRRQFYVDERAAGSYGDMRIGPPAPDAAGGTRRRLHIDERYADRRVAVAQPSVLVFPTITHGARSGATRLDAVQATGHLLAASGPQLFDRAHMRRHLTVLGALVRQTTAFRLHAGGDLLADPVGVLDRMTGTGS